MMWRLATVAVLACGVGLLGEDPKPAKTDDDLLQGTWQATAFDTGGGKLPPEAQTTKFIFKDGKLSTSHNGNAPESNGDYKLDATAKPKTIDLIKGKKVDPGIYQLDGDTLKLAIARGPDVKRPTEFKSDGMTTVVVTFKRMKDK